MPDIIDLKSWAEALKALTEALTNGMDAVHKYIDRREAANATKWTYVKEAGETATSLVIEHTKAVAVTTGPARKEYGLDDTAILFRRLVDDVEFPVAYEKLHGQLEQLIEEPEIGKKAGPTIRELRLRLIAFQSAAFMVEYSSWKVADAVEWVAEAVRILRGTEFLPAGAEARLVVLRAHLNQQDANQQNAWWKFKYLPGRPMPEPDVVEPKTADEMAGYAARQAIRRREPRTLAQVSA